MERACEHVSKNAWDNRILRSTTNQPSKAMGVRTGVLSHDAVPWLAEN